MSVASLISSKSADVGLGIYSVANIYNLDFIPVFEEEYDFIIPEKYLELEKTKNFISILRSDEFKNIINNMGGYIAEEPGRIII
jgi:putative molybdopterin biosynthesis protein